MGKKRQRISDNIQRRIKRKGGGGGGGEFRGIYIPRGRGEAP